MTATHRSKPDKMFIRYGKRIWSIQTLALLVLAVASCLAQGRASDLEREKQLHKLQFSQNFRSLQLNSQSMLAEHESGSLTTSRLSKLSKSINKSAKTLRTLIALGALATEPEDFDKNLANQASFDVAIRKLHKLIYDFAHSPVHKNSKVFNTKDAARTQIELLTIIELSKVIETQARDYTPVLLLKPTNSS